MYHTDLKAFVTKQMVCHLNLTKTTLNARLHNTSDTKIQQQQQQQHRCVLFYLRGLTYIVIFVCSWNIYKYA